MSGDGPFRAEQRWECGDPRCFGDLRSEDPDTWLCEDCDLVYVSDGYGLTHFPELDEEVQ